MDASPMIRARGLTRRFGERAAVDDVDLEIGRGEIFGLLGPNGAGKTTTISMLVTILNPSGGEASVNGFDVLRESAAVRRSIGIVFQAPSIDGILTGRENLYLHGRLYGVPRKELKARVEEMLALVSLTDRGDDLTRTYSGGMKRRLEIARGLLHRPAVLFLDEPTLGLDPQTREHVWDHIRKLREEFGTTIVLTTHYMEEADSLCDRVGIIDHGKIIALGTPAELKARLGGETVTLKPRGDAAKDLGSLPFVKQLETTAVGDVVLTVENAAGNLARIVQAAGEVERIEVRTPTLEDVFLHLTGHEMRDSVENESFADQYVQYQQSGDNR